ncbi:MAG: hypothetical protein SGI77_14435 [Pirellulaceae bacterium]|nr:hypothetical protein [Pirellulaceae bacterium]
MHENQRHEIRQPLTAISNFAGASRLLLEQKSTGSNELTAEDLATLMRWLEQITSLTVKIDVMIDKFKRSDSDD